MYEEFKNGSIISLSLKNFQTYSSAYFQFHPKLNFIAGPNGAGKSTLANAIAFIFGGTPRALGKGKDLTDFIKFDTTEATIEILLKIDEKRTVNIKRIISNFKNGTLWFLDNILTKWTKISELYENLKIDISNFCNYLPQEKVSEFSKCSPEELFKIFIEIYSDKKIEKNIEKLKRLEINLEIIKNDKNKIIKEKETVEKAINHMIKDIKKIKEKEELEKRLKLMKEKKNWIIYENEKKEYLKIKEKKEKIKKEIKNIEKENLEIEKEIKKEKENNKGIKKLEEKKEEIKKLNKNFLEKEEKIKNLEIEKEKNKLKIKINEKKREKEKNKIKELKKEKEEKEEKIKKIKIPEKPKKINYEKRDKIEKEINENKKNILKIKEKNKKIKKEIENLKNEKNILKNFELQRLEFLKKYHKETWKAVNWLRNNKEKFKEEIYEPLIMTLFIKEEKYILEIEGTITFQASISFIVKNHEDFIKFTKIMKEEKNWGINVVEQRQDEGLGGLGDEVDGVLECDGLGDEVDGVLECDGLGDGVLEGDGVEVLEGEGLSEVEEEVSEVEGKGLSDVEGKEVKVEEVGEVEEISEVKVKEVGEVKVGKDELKVKVEEGKDEPIRPYKKVPYTNGPYNTNKPYNTSKPYKKEPNNNTNKPYNNNTVKKLGFDGYLIDFVEDRKEVLDFLSISCNFSSIPVSHNKNLLKISQQILNKYNFNKIAVCGKCIQIKRSIYNKKDCFLIEYKFKRTGQFKQQGSIEKIEKKIKELEKEEEENEKKEKEEEKEIFNLTEKHKKITEEINIEKSKKYDYERKEEMYKTYEKGLLNINERLLTLEQKYLLLETDLDNTPLDTLDKDLSQDSRGSTFYKDSNKDLRGSAFDTDLSQDSRGSTLLNQDLRGSALDKDSNQDSKSALNTTLNPHLLNQDLKSALINPNLLNQDSRSPLINHDSKPPNLLNTPLINQDSKSPLINQDSRSPLINHDSNPNESSSLLFKVDLKFNHLKFKLEMLLNSIDQQIIHCFKNIIFDESVFFNIINEIVKINLQISEYHKIKNDLDLKFQINNYRIDEFNKEINIINEEKEIKKKRIQKLKSELTIFTKNEILIIGTFKENLEDLEKEIAKESTKITLINEDKNVLKDYKEKELLLKKYTERQLEVEETENISNTDINNMKEDVINYFKPRIEKINKNFEELFKKMNNISERGGGSDRGGSKGGSSRGGSNRGSNDGNGKGSSSDNGGSKGSSSDNGDNEGNQGNGDNEGSSNEGKGIVLNNSEKSDLNNSEKSDLNNSEKSDLNNSELQELQELQCYEGKVLLETDGLKLSKWRISIFVKFRKNEQLQQLTSFFQSGGERSVSTIIFLLSLINLTPTPFRLVDEINQGMDSYNERMVHKLLVDLVNDKDTSQFFIITPKLVDNLYFKDNMKIHILYAGDFVKMNEKFENYKRKILEQR